MSSINWTDPNSKVSTHFNVKDCLYLPQWSRLANEKDGLTQEIKDNLVNLCAKMEVIRTFFGNKPIIVHCMYRPIEYNKLVGGSNASGHLKGLAIDFHIQGLEGNEGCDTARKYLLPHLEEFNIRMEDISSKNSRGWIHLDLKPVVTTRYFKP